MELKKNPKADLESKKQIFLLIALIIALLGTIFAMEYKKWDEEEEEAKKDDFIYEEEEIMITREQKPPPPEKPPPPPPEVPEEIEIKENEEELEHEIEIESSETDEDEMIEEEESVEPFISVEKMPMLGDCEDEACTQTEIMKFIAKNFKYPEIAKANGVEGRVILEFVVEKNGKVGRVKILRGLDKYVDKAAIEVIEKLNDKKSPKFSPGRQIGKAVPVKYTVPIKCTLG